MTVEQSSTRSIRLLKQVSSWIKGLISGREGLAVIISMLSVLVATFSLWVANSSLDLAVRVENTAKEKELKARLLFLTGSPSKDGAIIRIWPSNPNTIFRSMRVKLEYSEYVSEFELPPGSDTLSMEYIRPYLRKRIENLKQSDRYKDVISSLVPPGVGEYEGAIPILVYTEYVVFGELLEDLSLYRLTFKASWSMAEPSEKLQFTGIAFCKRVPVTEKEEWLSDDHVFVGVDIGGSISGPRTVRFVNC